MKIKLIELVVVFGILIVVASGFAPTWTQTAAPTNRNYASIAMSADGRVILSVNSQDLPIFSTNGGNTWTTNTGIHGYNCAASSADGKTLIFPSISASLLYLSTNAGATWSTKTLPSQDRYAIAISADGTQFASAIHGGGIWLSTNVGATWFQSSAPNNLWRSLASVANGTKLMAVSDNGPLYISTNAGTTWSAKAVGGVCVAASINGRMIAVAGMTNIYVSTNGGSNWRTNAVNGYSVAVSADGKEVIVGSGGPAYAHGSAAPVCTSMDYGMSWTTNDTLPTDSWLVGLSADGCKFVAMGNGIWTAQITPAPQLNLQSINSRLAFSWLLPSTNFALQKNTNLLVANWVTLTNQLALNVTNLQNGLTLSLSNSTGFFRLIAQ